MQLHSLEAWLSYISSLNAEKIQLGLERIQLVAERLQIKKGFCPLVIVGGTNGKGSTVAGLEAIYREQGYKVGVFTSPYLIRHNEEVRIDGVDADDETFCAAFARVEAARQDVGLTLFEFNTLAALSIFQAADLDVCLLEVGLGGRLDAVNIMDADVAVVTTVAMDHMDWLGDTRDLIGREKAGIFRSGKPAVCGDFLPPVSLQQFAVEKSVPVFYQGKDFVYELTGETWSWRSSKKFYENLPRPTLALQNMATVLMVTELLENKLPVDKASIVAGLKKVNLVGRIQVVPGVVTQILDVSHNPAAAERLASVVKESACLGKTRAVFSMLRDKDILGTVEKMKEVVDSWYIASLDTERAAGLEKIENALVDAGVKEIQVFSDMVTAFEAAKQDSVAGDRVVVFGSFYTVAAVLERQLPLA